MAHAVSPSAILRNNKYVNCSTPVLSFLEGPVLSFAEG
jgi:hypothetical protein